MAGLGAYPVITEPKPGHGPSKNFQKIKEIEYFYFSQQPKQQQIINDFISGLIKRNQIDSNTISRRSRILILTVRISVRRTGTE